MRGGGGVEGGEGKIENVYIILGSFRKKNSKLVNTLWNMDIYGQDENRARRVTYM